MTILKSMKDTENSYTLLTSQNGDPGFSARISELFYQEFQPRMAQDLPGCTEDEKNTAYLFVAGGCGHLISAWIKNGMQTPPKQVAEELGAICSTFVKSYGGKRASCPQKRKTAGDEAQSAPGIGCN